jgi:hypothetical protein
MLVHHPLLLRGLVLASLLSALALSNAARAGQTGRGNPLGGDGTNPVVYYYDYSNDGVTTDQIIHDKTNNTTDTVPLLNPHPYYAFLGNPPARDDLATSLVDGSSHLDDNGGPPGPPFQFASGAGLDFLLPGSLPLDLDATGHGAITVTKNALTHQNISDAGGFTFETYVKRTTDTTGNAKQIIWSPEGSHQLEITQAGNLQIQLSGLTAPISVPVNTALPVGEWHHLMAVLDVTQPLPPGGDPQQDALVANYSLFVDGQLVGTTPDANLISGNCCILEFLDHEHGIGGSYFGASTEYFRGQMALTRLSLGALTLEQSLFLLPPVPNDGDYNANGKVDPSDYVLWRKSLGASVNRGVGADGSSNGTIDSPDYIYWRSRYGLPPASGSLAGDFAVIPEPTTQSVLLAGCVVLAWTSRWIGYRSGARENRT